MRSRRILLATLLLCVKSIFSQDLFPGYSVQHFNSESGMQNTIKGLLTDSKGFLWLGTESGLVRFDGQRFRLIDHSVAGTPVNRVTEIGLTDQDAVYIMSNASYYILDPTNKLVSAKNPPQFIKHSSYLSVVKPAKLYESCKKKFNDKKIKKWALPDFKRIAKSFQNSVVYKDGYFFYLNEDAALIAADTTLTTFSLMKTVGLKEVKQPHINIEACVVQRDGEVFMRWGKYLYGFNISRQADTAYFHQVLYVGDIANVVAYLRLPQSNISFVGTLADGIYMFQKQDFSTLELKANEQNIFYAQASFGKDGVLTKRGVIYRNKFTPLPNNYDPITILRLTDGTYYMARRDMESSGLTHLSNNLKPLSEIPTNRELIRCIKQLQDGSIWLCKDSFFLGRIQQDTITWLKKPPHFPSGYNINDFIQADDETFWLAGNIGLAKYDLKRDQAFFIKELNGINVRALFKDSLGVIWICTYGNGLYAYDKNQLISLPLDVNLYLEYPHTIMPDKKGFFWISTNHGLFRVDQKSLHAYLDNKNERPYYYYFDRSSGFLTNEFNGGCSPAGIELGNGKFSLPSLKGLVQFFPDSIQPLRTLAPIFIDHLLADTQEIAFNSSISIPPNTRRFQIHITSPYFGNSNNQNIEYKISATDNNWFHINKDYIIELTNLPGGRHTIFFRKQTGPSTYVFKELNFFVQPALTETFFFKIIITLLVASLLYLIYRIRVQFLRQQKQQLRKQVIEQTKEQQALIADLETVVEELEKSREDLQQTIFFKERLAMIVTHDLQSPLRFLSDAMERMHKKTLKQHPELEATSNELRKVTANMHHFIEDLSIWIKKANGSHIRDETQFKLLDITRELEIFFDEINKSKENTVIIEISQTVEICSDRQIIKIILRNLMDNAIKYTNGGTIEIKFINENNTGTLHIKDTGEGMKDEVFQMLENYIKQDPLEDNKSVSGPGYGYRFIKDFCSVLNLQIEIDSSRKNGTTVTLTNLKTLEKPMNYFQAT